MERKKILSHLCRLNFDECFEISGEIYALGPALKNLTTLQSLNLSLRIEDISDDEFSSLTEGVKALVSLRNLDIFADIYDADSPDKECLNNFAQALKTLRYLENISLRLRTIRTEEDSQEYVKDIFDPALKNFPYLKTLSVSLKG